MSDVSKTTTETVVAIQGVPVDATAPAGAALLFFDGTQWTPIAVAPFLMFSGGPNVAAASASYSVDSDGQVDGVVLADSSAGAIAITLPGTSGDYRTVTIKDAGGNSATHNITIVPQAGETIEGASSFVLSTDSASVVLTRYGSNWSIVSGYKL